MDLTPKDYRTLAGALSDAFPNEDSLNKMVYYTTGLYLSRVVKISTMENMIFSLIHDWAIPNGKVGNLIMGALQEYPGNPKLQQFCLYYWLVQADFTHEEINVIYQNVMAGGMSTTAAAHEIGTLELLAQLNKISKHKSTRPLPIITFAKSAINHPKGENVKEPLQEWINLVIPLQSAEQQDNQLRVTELVARFRSALISGNAHEALRLYRQLTVESLIAEVGEYDRLYIHRLWEIVQGNDFESGQILSMFEAWPDEFAGALCIAAEQFGKNRQDLRQMLRAFPIDRCSEETQKWVFQTRQRLKADHPPQPRVWPTTVVNKKLSHLTANLKNPWIDNDALLEEEYLFRAQGGLFWRDHPLFLLSEQSHGPLLAFYGENGSGKTALALALGKYARSPFTLGTYLDGVYSTEDILTGLGTTLLNFILNHPTFLTDCPPHVKQLTGSVLVTARGVESLKAEIRRRSNPDTWNWLRRAETPRQSAQWKVEASTQLTGLEKQINTAKVVDPREWFLILQEVCQALKFEAIRLCLDINQPVEKNWLEEEILRYKALWSYAGIQTFLFSSSEDFQKNSTYLPNAKPISWTSSQLDTLFRSRWQTVNPTTNPEFYFANPDEFSMLIERANGLPGRLCMLWQEHVKSRSKPK
jgi:hypothetical protein